MEASRLDTCCFVVLGYTISWDTPRSTVCEALLTRLYARRGCFVHHLCKKGHCVWLEYLLCSAKAPVAVELRANFSLSVSMVKLRDLSCLSVTCVSGFIVRALSLAWKHAGHFSPSCAAGMLGCGLSRTFTHLLVARFVTGMGSALQMSGSQLFLADISKRHNRARSLGTNHVRTPHFPPFPSLFPSPQQRGLWSDRDRVFVVQACPNTIVIALSQWAWLHSDVHTLSIPWWAWA